MLATLPEKAGGEQFIRVQVVDDALHVGHSVDAVLTELEKERSDAVSVFRNGERAAIGATSVAGIDGATLFEAFVRAWNASPTLEREQRLAAGGVAWELRDRLGNLTVLYRLGNVVYLVQTTDRALLEAILLDMPPIDPN